MGFGGLAVGLGRGDTLQGWLGTVGVPGVSRDGPRVSVVVGPRAGVLGVFGSWMVPAALSRGPCCVLAGPSPPLPASPRPARVTAPCSLPLSGAEPASPHVGVIPGLCWPVSF